MKRILFMLAFVCAVVSANAQVAYEKAKWYDNWSIGATVGATTPLDFNSVMPLNTNFGIKLQKDFTPIFGLQAEGLVFVNDNHFRAVTHHHECNDDTHQHGDKPVHDDLTWVKAFDVNVNGLINWSNVFCGYKGTPRLFEISTVTGLGWLYMYDTNNHYLTAKTGLDLAFNLGKSKTHSIVLTPAVYWNLSATNKIQFNKKYAQLGLNVSYIYHFKNSNGTHSFKLYDVGAMNSEINDLRGTNSSLTNRVNGLENANNKLKTENSDLAAENEKLAKYKNDGRTWTVEFAQGSSELTSDATAILDKVAANESVTVLGTASPEGSSTLNNRLSEARANAVASYLTNKGVKVTRVKGVGASTNSSNRLALVGISE